MESLMRDVIVVLIILANNPITSLESSSIFTSVLLSQVVVRISGFKVQVYSVCPLVPRCHNMPTLLEMEFSGSKTKILAV